MESKKVIHFGAGALGRGLVIPVLTDSGCDVTIVDSDDELIDHINKNHGYQMFIANEEKGKQYRTIPVARAYSLNHDMLKINEALNDINTITTSVRRGNLINVAKLLANAWQSDGNFERLVICCENIEHVSKFFKDLLLSFALSDEHEKILQKVIVPDTVVDRGCTPSAEDRMVVETEKYFEIGVDKNVIANTGIKLISEKENIQKDFYRKRFLINTYADVIAFFAIEMHFDNFSDALKSKELQDKIVPYMDIVREALVLEFRMSREDLNYWIDLYKDRFGGNTQKTEKKAEKKKQEGRELTSIARSIWDKLAYDERFVYPIILAKKHGYNVNEGIKLIAEMVGIEIRNDGCSLDKGIEKIEKMWCIDDSGCYLFNKVKDLLVKE